MHLSHRRGAAALLALAGIFPALVAPASPALGAPSEGPPSADLVVVDDEPAGEQVELEGVDLAALGFEGTPPAPIDFADLGAPVEGEGRTRLAALGQRLSLLRDNAPGYEEILRVLGPEVRRLERVAAEARGADEVASARRVELDRRARERAGEAEDAVEALDDHLTGMAEMAVAAYVSPPDLDSVGSVLADVVPDTAQLAGPELLDAKWEHDELRRAEMIVDADFARRRSAESAERAAFARIDADQAAERRAEADSTLELHAAALAWTDAISDGIDHHVELLTAEIATAVQSLQGEVLALVQADHRAPVPIAVVDGFRVHAAIATQLAAMLEAARLDGIVLAGWGHRSHEQQIALRRRHCGDTPEDVWLKPPGECAPPTAVPGTSLHELGLAVDLTHDGAAIDSQSSPAFQWLAEHAATFGFHNLPSEPWHWSVNGS